MKFENTPYIDRKEAIEWLMTHVDILEDAVANEYNCSDKDDEYTRICKARSKDILESLLNEVRNTD